MNTNSSNEKVPKSFFAHKLALRHGLTKRIAPVLLAVSALAVGGWAIGNASPDGESPEYAPAPRSLPVATIAAQPVSSYQGRRSYTGRLVARRSTQLAFQRTGQLEQLHADEGQSVRSGDRLASLDVRRLEARRDELRAVRAAAAAGLAEMVAGPRAEVIGAARARVASWEAQVRELELQKLRRQRLLESKAASREDFENTTHRLTAAEARRAEARHQLDELVNGTRAEKIEAQRAVVAQLDAQLAEVAIEIEDSTIVAPFGGTIAERLVDDGTVVSPATPIFRIVEDGQLEAWIGLPVDAARIAVGQDSHKIEVDGKSYDAQPARRLPELDAATRTRTVILTLSAEDSSQLVTGQIARLHLLETVDQSGFWVPTTALLENQRGLWSVYVAAPQEGRRTHRAVRRDVEVLHAESDRVLVRGTLRAGDLVIAGGVHRIVSDQFVDPVD